MPRPPREGIVGNAVNKNRFFLTAVVALLIPYLVGAQQQQPAAGIQRRHESPHEGFLSDVAQTIEATRLSIQPQQLETLLTADRRKRTLSAENHVKKNDASAIATLAPAETPYRAPAPARRSSSETAGLSTPITARSLEDWWVSTSGRLKNVLTKCREVSDFILLATVDGKLYARDRKTGKEKWALEVDKPMVETTYYRRNRSSVEEDYRALDDYLWIVEPSQDGSLYVYTPGGTNPGLVNTGLTMKKLVEEMSPYEDKESSIIYTGDKRTTMITLDARSGRVLKWFGSGGALVNDEQSCAQTADFIDPDGDACSTTGTLTLGRTEYTVGIQSKEGHQIATLKYSEWGPNNYDNDLHRQYRTTLDSKYVYSSHDGSVFGYDHAHTDEPGRLFKQKFSSPVVRVFDIARPWGTENSNPDLVVLPQPIPPVDDEKLARIRNSRIFLNHTEAGSWYAMSGSSYPLVVDGPEQAKCDRREFWQHAPLWEELNDAQVSKALVGLHSIDGVRSEKLLTISAPDEVESQTSMLEVPQPDLEDSILTTIGQLPKTAMSSLFDFVSNPVMILVIIALCSLYYKDIVAWIRSWQSGAQRSQIIEADMTPAATVELAVPAHEPEPATIDQVKTSEISSLDVPVEEDLGLADSQKENDPVGELSTSVSLDVPQDAGPQPTLEKKKAHRGRRGGLKHKKGGRAASEGPQALVVPVPTVEDAVRDAKKLGEQPKIEPDVQTVNNGVAEISGPILRLNSLEVNTEKLIGTGSNGTMVFEGKFDGRDVAVKRMLIQFFDIASQETRLLRESDDHPNGKQSYMPQQHETNISLVIRYFAQQQSAGFLYIALELCPASLADVIEKPHLHKDLAQAGERDLPGVLYQITNGLQHLHNLRIVHRDLKPQNILVAKGKDSRPRLLVSDFGLCKKLEGEQSSFRATTAHAAGTSGWRAPELLLDDDANESTMIDASTHSGSGSLLLSPELMPNRRATRAIDIFSLGLVFFYVLTGGAHPFDCGDRYMREVNIRKARFDLRPLEVLGDFSYEARDLIGSMLEAEPKRRPSARQVMAHPFFWSAKKRLNFLCDVSDHFEKEKREPPSPALLELEAYAPSVTRGDFLKPLGKDFVESMGKQRKYTGNRLLDLLRALRNKKNHYEDMSDALKEKTGPLPDGYLTFWTRKFPNLLICCWNVIYALECDDSDRFAEYYEPSTL